MEDVVEGTRAAYEQIAKTYAEVNSGDVPDSLLRLARELVHHVGHDANIIDVGCGTGRDMAWFEGQGMRVTGVDFSPAMLAQARGLTAGPLLRMDLRRLAYRDASFGGAWCAASLLHLPKREAPGALHGIRRVLMPRGILVLSVKEGDGEAWAEGYVEGVMRFFAYYRQAEMASVLADAGFAVREAAESASRSHGDWLSFFCVAT